MWVVISLIAVAVLYLCTTSSAFLHSVIGIVISLCVIAFSWFMLSIFPPKKRTQLYQCPDVSVIFELLLYGAVLFLVICVLAIFA